MIWAAVSLVAFLAVAIAAAWPYLRQPASPALTPAARADWVNRLFVLAGTADDAGLADVAAAARELVAALVGPKEPAKRGK